jgi:spore germination protein YaaH
MAKILANIKKVPIWDDQSKSSYVINSPHGLYEYLFIENARSFTERLNLSKRYHLRGISVWQLQFEDPLIWRTLG